MLFAIADKETSRALVKAYEGAVAAVGYLEREACRARRGPGGGSTRSATGSAPRRIDMRESGGSAAAAGASFPRGVAVDAGHVYWANADAGSIRRANLDGTGANQSFIGAASGPVGVAVDAG